MRRMNQIVFVVSLLGLSWLGMMAIHELGHVLGAWLSGAEVVRVILHPLTISRTDLGENPFPLIVVWAGPMTGVLAPLAVWAMAGGARLRPLTPYLQFFAGFCLISNGVYIALGWPGRVGDCGVMLRAGTPIWVMLLFGLITVPLGLGLWHRLGSIGYFAKNAKTPAVATLTLAVTLLLVVALTSIFSPR